MTLLVWTLLAPARHRCPRRPPRLARRSKEIVIIGGLSLTFGLCLATAGQFLDGPMPAAFDDALRVDGLSALVLVLCGFVGLLSAAYGVGYLQTQRGSRPRHAAHAPRVLRC